MWLVIQKGWFDIRMIEVNRKVLGVYIWWITISVFVPIK
jgi:hypothetical protein